ncbi:MAG TPA: hypothetical protein VGE27_15620 [Gemmatimonas sp.]|uniref:hypothetical protein n=1 Tax=Gemmatimonas sp. TaxID=1962908 RepID=UPI002ED98F39
MAIVRHEFHPQYHVALATLSSETCRFIERVSASPSLIAPVRGTMACSAVSLQQRSSSIVVIAAIIPSYHAPADQFADTANRFSIPFASSRDVLRRSRRTPDCARLLEAA